MALPTAPHTQSDSNEADFLRDVMGFGGPVATTLQASTEGDTEEEESVFTGVESPDEVLAKLQADTEVNRAEHQERQWHDLQPRIQEYANRKGLWLSIVGCLVTGLAVGGLWFLAESTEPEVGPIVIEQQSGLQVPDEYLDQ